MSNNQTYPFQRNRYYMGKLLTSADFQAEQDYYNNRDRFKNSLLYGPGIICGLGVVSLDDLSILIESGVALDGVGREIVQDTSLVRKLSAIEGFENLATSKAALCIRYEDAPVNSVFTVGKSQTEQDFEYSRINEESRLFLMDSCDVPDRYELETEFFTSGVLYQDGDFLAQVVSPSTVCRGRMVKFVVSLKKLSSENVNFTLHGTLQLPGFKTAEGLQSVEVDFDEISLLEGEKIEKEYWVLVENKDTDDTSIILQSGMVHAYKDDEAVEISSSFDLKVLISDIHPRELVNHEIGRMSLEMMDLGGSDDFIRLADISFEKTGNSYIINDIDEDVKKYISTPSQEIMRDGYLDYFYRYSDLSNSSSVITTTASKQTTPEKMPAMPEIATGTVEIPLGNNARKGSVRYSGEILHGLGNGNVFVSVGFELVATDDALNANAKSTIYGNADLFRNEKNEAPMVETAIKVLNDKGSFVVAVKLLEDLDYLVLTYRFVAIKFPTGDGVTTPDDYAGKSIIPETPTVVLETRESHYFGVRFENMKNCSVVYELTEEGSGDITPEGIYTAPSKEGVYEIRIYCAEMPIICAYAYAIVKKKGVDGDNALASGKGAILNDLPI